MGKLSSPLIVSLILAWFTGNNAVFGIAGDADLETARQAGIQAVLDDPGAYGLYTDESILDLNLGGIMLKAGEGGFAIDFALEISDDLSTWGTWESFQRILPNEGGKSFLRLRAFLPPDEPSSNILIHQHAHFGPILIDADGYALYRLEFDVAGAAPVNHLSWPAAQGPDEPVAFAGISAAIGVGTGGHLTINDFPVYRHADDVPGSATGQGAGSVWWLINPDGSLNITTLPADPDDPGDSGGPPDYEPPPNPHEPPPGYGPPDNPEYSPPPNHDDPES